MWDTGSADRGQPGPGLRHDRVRQEPKGSPSAGVRQGCPLSPLLFICVIELLAERIRQNRDIRRVIVPGSSRKGEVKCSLYMDDVSVFCADGHSIKELEKTCIEFGKASGAKINSAKSETLLLGHWTPTAIPQAGFHEDPWSLVRQKRRSGEIMGRKTGKDEAEAGTLEPSEANDRREVFGPAERDPASAPVRRTSMASAASNGQGHHKNDLLLHLELQDG
ncbi:hypothetical protein NDU88_002615 [Pleurodeles waltl]|uniref:Reverse transcriptase domain-containing protein n=1 Tax=Pleurodeles waltl TaxID=8319 RepID=A0AAV7RAH1_PLEWA|nr:hypothetical protein NDU88_002615 [Pleurodeles waltl]